MRIAWIGSHFEGMPALRALLERKVGVEGVITLKPEQAVKRSGAVDYGPLCREFGVPMHQVANINDPEAVELLRTLSPDLVFVIGWSQIIRSEALQVPRIGLIGAHASYLPHNRGSAPVNWSLIKGETRTGNSLIWLAEEVDSGAIIDQTEIPISPYDTCETLYQRVAESNRDMILRQLHRLLAGERPGFTQPHTDESILPRRRPKDGLINWNQGADAVYNFVRALAKPYPGAFSWLDGQRWFIWKCALLSLAAPPDAKPGQILGPCISPEEAACGQIVACGNGTLVVLNAETENGTTLQGYALSNQNWSGQVWRNE
jgi:methionyl-tRNA formyltransferase